MGRTVPATRAADARALLSDERLTLLGLFAETFIGLAARLEADLERHGLGPVEFEVLVRLARSPGQRLRMSDLTAQTALTSSGVTRLVDRLERDGLVSRAPCPEDRRITWAVLTEAGEDRVVAVLPGHLDVAQAWLTDLLSPEELAAFATTLRRLRDAVHPAALAGTPGWAGCLAELEA